MAKDTGAQRGKSHTTECLVFKNRLRLLGYFIEVALCRSQKISHVFAFRPRNPKPIFLAMVTWMNQTQSHLFDGVMD